MSSFIMAGSLLQSRIQLLLNTLQIVGRTYLLISSSENIFKMYSGHQYSWAFLLHVQGFMLEASSTVRSRGSFFIQHNFPI